MWVLLSDGGAVNVNKLDAIAISNDSGKYFLEFVLGGRTRRIKGSFNTLVEATNALVAVTGAVDAAA